MTYDQYSVHLVIHMTNYQSNVPLSSLSSHLLPPQTGLVSSDGTQTHQLRLLLAQPVIELSEADEEEAGPVLACVLQPRSDQKDTINRLSTAGLRVLKFISLILL